MDEIGKIRRATFLFLQGWGRTNARTAVNVTGGRGAWRCTDIVTQVWNDSSVTCASHDSAWKRSLPSTFTATSGKNRTSAISVAANMANVTNWRHTNAGTRLRRRLTDRSPTRSPRSSSSIQNRPTSRSTRVQRVGDTSFSSNDVFFVSLVENNARKRVTGFIQLWGIMRRHVRKKKQVCI